tara:strand:- start:109 stop:231 length:123 start_codon:yes stop_codon:yes gene_type:complete
MSWRVVGATAAPYPSTGAADRIGEMDIAVAVFREVNAAHC